MLRYIKSEEIFYLKLIFQNNISSRLSLTRIFNFLYWVNPYFKKIGTLCFTRLITYLYISELSEFIAESARYALILEVKLILFDQSRFEAPKENL